MFTTFSGIFMLVSPSQHLNAQLPIVVTPFPKITSFKLLQKSNE